MSFYTDAELSKLGFKYLGKNVRLSSKTSFYNASNISIGDNSRIDDFCVISAGNDGIDIGRNVHIACFCSLIGKANITLGDFSGLSSRVAVYSSSDDYSGQFMTNPTVPPEFTGVDSRPVYIGKHAIIGAGAIVLPGTYVEEGVAVGALGLVKGRCEEWQIYAGSPLKAVKGRKKNILELEAEMSLKESKLE